ncbi:flagellar hook capping FlgD N-terminal domain-containing protein [Rhodovulum adriaticum]|uniref:Basal-body rod modification protein FlgD n=1 Tax=Rhodovulum adriaticum TaxID=35804 RepID=A0A4R2P1C7_RHOAD|nr:flagellar hook capping FlgD N-terminal domain-containing protein [Rhodovulum adriaticum]MBK1636743.1 hypothetical protein [Rhodovulum adriaticum]TCP27671.1 flagellar basal-body rod modification protein FlgD [Rhodovulum adriaticum]
MDSTTPLSARTGGTAQTASTTATGGGAIATDFETFLKMLTAQMQNQDPLNPIESADYAVQIATFSGVEQQVRTNQLLEDMTAALGATGLSAYAGWVGHEVQAAAPALFAGSPITVVPQIAEGADSAVLVVRDADGAEVQRLDIGTGGEPLDWAGVGDTGMPLAQGVYRFVVESYAEGARIGEGTAATYGTVTEVLADGDGIRLRLAGGAEVAADSVTALRQAGG